MYIVKLLILIDFKQYVNQFKPFWKSKFKNKYKKIWIPDDTKLIDVNNSNINICSLDNNSIIKIDNNINNTFKLTDNNKYETKIEIIKSMKIRIQPNQFQRQKFEEYFNTTRYIWNQCVKFTNDNYSKKKDEYNKLKKNGCVFKDIKGVQCKNKLNDKINYYLCDEHIKTTLDWGIIINFQNLRKQIHIPTKKLNNNNKWLKNTPSNSRQLIIKKFCSNLKSAIKNKQLGNIDKFEFKSKKDDKNIFLVDHRSIKSDLTIFSREFKTNKKLKKKNKKIKIPEIKKECIIKREGHIYYLIIPYTDDKKYEKPKVDTISLDPGVRTFLYGYSPDGIVSELNPNKNKLKCKINRINKLIKLIGEKKIKNDIRIKRKLTLLRTKIKNFIDDFHWKTINYLVKNYNNIIIPKFGVKNMVRKDGRKINKEIVKELLILSHFSFRNKLIIKCDEYQRNLILTTEEFTTRTCGRCGVINNKVGCNKIFNCYKCDLNINRDLNGARNILLKYISK